MDKLTKRLQFKEVVKHYGNQKFEVAVVQDSDSMYCIRWNTAIDEMDIYSEYVADYNVATFLFDHKIKQLEGN